MNKIAGLPKTARVICVNNYVRDLKIKNHVVVNSFGLLNWLIQVIGQHHLWNDILPQLISQGFKVDAVIEQCIADMQNSDKFLWILYKFGRHRHTSRKLDKLISTGQAKQVQREITARLKACQNWDQLFHALDRNDISVKKMFKEWSNLTI